MILFFNRNHDILSYTGGAYKSLVVTPNFTESVAESVDYGKYMRFDFPHIKGAYETANHH